MTKCAWCNIELLKPDEKKPITNEIRVCGECGGRNSFIAVSFSLDPDGIVTQMIPTAWCPTNEGLPSELQPRKWKSTEEGQRELNNLLQGRRKR
jgi:hypothetical protein